MTPSATAFSASPTKFPARRSRFELKLPHNPLSAVTTNSNVGPSGRASGGVSNGCSSGSTRVARLLSVLSMSRANGRAPTMRSCARRSFDAATVFIALVICCVDDTARMRRRMSMSDGIVYAATPFRAATNCSVNALMASLTAAFNSSSNFFCSVSRSSRSLCRVSMNW